MPERIKFYTDEHVSRAVIEGLPEADLESPVQIFHAGTTKSRSGEFIAAGGRVLGVTATGPTLAEALSRCYKAVRGINWDGMQYRRDIGGFSH